MRGLPTVPQVAHLLLALLGLAQTLPVQLRLLALQEVSPTPGSQTLREFSARLAAFERPNRHDAIRDVYERFLQLPARGPEPAAAEPPSARRVQMARPAWWKSRRLRSAAAAAGLVLAAIIAAAWLWQVAGPLLSGQDARQRDNAGAGGAGGESLSAEAVERIFATARRIWGGVGTRPGTPLDARPVAVTTAPELPAGPSPKPVAPPPETAAPIVAGRTAPDTRLFSAADADVVPPGLVRPHLPTAPAEGVRAESLPQVELVISPAGEVESVKLLTVQAGVKTTMMLSAIKAWRFEPATRAGRPVRYRLVVRLTNQ
jgi:hypothetical protein